MSWIDESLEARKLLRLLRRRVELLGWVRMAAKEVGVVSQTETKLTAMEITIMGIIDLTRMEVGTPPMEAIGTASLLHHPTMNDAQLGSKEMIDRTPDYHPDHHQLAVIILLTMAGDPTVVIAIALGLGT